MILARTESELRGTLGRWRSERTTVGLVPTGGSLHRGHEALIDRCVANSEVCVVSISSICPESSGAGEATEEPPELARDVKLASQLGADILFVRGDRGGMRATDDLAEVLDLVRPNVVFYGRSDLRKTVWARRLAARADRGIEVDVAPIVRESDGLAVAAANDSLDAEERNQAAGLVRGLEAARRSYRSGERSREALLGAVRAVVERYPLLELEQVEVVRVDDLTVTDPVSPSSAVMATVRCGAVVLVDNLLLSEAR